MKPRPALLVLASTYPRWAADPEPGFVHELARRLTNRFHVTVLCPHAPGATERETMDGVDVIRYRYAPQAWETLVNDGGIVTNLRRAKWKYLLVPGLLLVQVWQAWRLVRRRRVDVIHAHWLIPQGLIAALLQWLPGRKVPFVVTSHGADLYALKGRWLDRIKTFVARRAAAVTVVSTAMCDRMVALGVPASKVNVQPMGVDLTDRFVPDPSVPRSERDMLFVGRLVEKKGLRHLLEAMPHVLRQVPDASLGIAGFGPEENALRDQVRALGLEAHVRFLGAVPQSRLPDLYRRAALFVAPFVQAGSGDQEGLGLVVVEAAGCGCPIVVGNVPAVRDVLGDQHPACVDPRDPTGLATALVNVLVDPDVAARQAGSLRRMLAGKFDWSKAAQGYMEVLSEQHNRGAAARARN